MRGWACDGPGRRADQAFGDPMTFLGLLPLAFLLPLIGLGGWLIWRRPVLSLPVFALGLALHNLVLMLVISAGMPEVGIRVVQAWKEVYVGILVVRLALGLRSSRLDRVRQARTAWFALPASVRLLDVAALGFATVLVAYLFLPSASLGGVSPSIAQRLLSFRTLILIPILYLFGRAWSPFFARDRGIVLGGVAAVAAFVSLIGIIELWFLPTRFWLDWGIIRFESFQGYAFKGPGGLPENFFQSTSTGLGLRRMVSTYLSPLGIAYTGLVVAPIAVVDAISPRRPSVRPWVAFAMVVIGISLSLTRLALGCLVGEAVLLSLIYRSRYVAAASGFAIAVAIAALLVYPNIGPIVDFGLADVRPPIGADVLGVEPSEAPSRSPGQSGMPASTPAPAPSNVSGDIVKRIVSGEDASIRAHLLAVSDGAQFIVAHPLGVGLGASVPRRGEAIGPGESAIFQIGAELGLLGFALFGALYGGVLLVAAAALRANRGAERFPLMVAVLVAGVGIGPIVLSSQVWGDLSVTFIYWWLAGAAISTWATRWRRNAGDSPYREDRVTKLA